jgi:hypothetical protein
MRKINLSIPEPCHENWDKMTKTEKGRFCDACAKTVFDFTNMSDRELAEFFKKPPASACGRLQQSQLDRDILIPRKRIPWIKYFFQFGLPAFLLSSKAQAQGEIRVKDSTKCTVVAGGVKAITAEDISADNKRITGKIKDAEGNPIPFASIQVKGTKYEVTADANGFFETEQKPGATLVITAIGYETREIVAKDAVQNIILTVTLSDITTGGAIVVTRHRKKPVPLIKHVIDTAFKAFSVYPNPVRPNLPFKIDTRNLEKAVYVMTILTDKSELVQESEVTIENKNQLIDCVINETTTGIYFIRFTNKKSGKSFTEKIMVQ